MVVRNGVPNTSMWSCLAGYARQDRTAPREPITAKRKYVGQSWVDRVVTLDLPRVQVLRYCVD